MMVRFIELHLLIDGLSRSEIYSKYLILYTINSSPQYQSPIRVGDRTSPRLHILKHGPNIKLSFPRTYRLT
jgi:hypothetical protein